MSEFNNTYKILKNVYVTGGTLTTTNNTYEIFKTIHDPNASALKINVSNGNDYWLPLTGGTITGDVTIDGRLTIQTGTTISTETVLIEDNILVLNNGELGSGVTEGTSGWYIDRGQLPDAYFQWDESNETFHYGISGQTDYILPNNNYVAKSGDTMSGDLVINGDLMVTGEIKSPEQFVIQFAASSLNPVGSIGGANLVQYGITTALEFPNNVTTVSFVNYKFPDNVDVTKPLYIRFGYASDTNTGDVYWGLKYRYANIDEDLTIEDGEVFSASSVSTTTNGLVIYNMLLPTPAANKKSGYFRLTRYGSNLLDTNSGSAFLVGISLVGTTLD